MIYPFNEVDDIVSLNKKLYTNYSVLVGSRNTLKNE